MFWKFRKNFVWDFTGVEIKLGEGGVRKKSPRVCNGRAEPAGPENDRGQNGAGDSAPKSKTAYLSHSSKSFNII